MELLGVIETGKHEVAYNSTPADTRRKNNVIITQKRRRDVVLT